MTDLADVVVGDLFSDDLEHLDSVVDERLRAVRSPIPRALTRPVAEKVGSAVRDVLDIKVLDLVVAAWTKASEILKYRSDTSGATITLFIGEHDLSATLKPKIRLEFIGIEHLEIVFSARVWVHIKAAELSIRNGHLISVGRSLASLNG